MLLINPQVSHKMPSNVNMLRVVRTFANANGCVYHHQIFRYMNVGKWNEYICVLLARA